MGWREVLRELIDERGGGAAGRRDNGRGGGRAEVHPIDKGQTLTDWPLINDGPIVLGQEELSGVGLSSLVIVDKRLFDVRYIGYRTAIPPWSDTEGAVVAFTGVTTPVTVELKPLLKQPKRIESKEDRAKRHAAIQAEAGMRADSGVNLGVGGGGDKTKAYGVVLGALRARQEEIGRINVENQRIRAKNQAILQEAVRPALGTEPLTYRDYHDVLDPLSGAQRYCLVVMPGSDMTRLVPLATSEGVVARLIGVDVDGSLIPTKREVFVCESFAGDEAATRGGRK